MNLIKLQTTSEVNNITQTDKKGVESSSRKNNTKIRFEKTQAYSKYRQLINRSAEKLKNSAFQKKFAGKTQSTTLKMVNRIVRSTIIASNNKIRINFMPGSWVTKI